MRTVLALLTALCLTLPANAQQTLTLPAIADNSIVMVENEWADNAGDKARLRIKGNQHIVILAFDTAQLRGRQVRSAKLVCDKASDQVIAAATISTIAVPWNENNSSGLDAGIGAGGWGAAGIRFPAVSGGNAHTLTHSTLTQLQSERYEWDVAPDLIHALATGTASGLAIHEHDADYSRNPSIFSREQSGKGPRLVLQLSPENDATPAPPQNLRLQPGPGGIPELLFKAPASGFAYDVLVDGKSLPRTDIPNVLPSGEQFIPLHSLDDQNNSAQQPRKVTVEIVTLNRTGSRSAKATLQTTLPARSPARSIPVTAPRPAATPAVRDLAVLPVQDRYDQDGNAVGDLPADYRVNNSMFDGRTVRLTAAAGEVTGLQIIVRGSGRQRISLKITQPGFRTEISQALFVKCANRLIPDPLLPFSGEAELQPKIDLPLFADIFVPFDAPPQRVSGRIEVSDGRQLPLELTVLPVSLPRAASFLCEMNSYGLPDHVDDYYALQQAACDHRVHLNILHYSQQTAAPGARKSNLDMRLRSGRRMDNRKYDSVQPGDTTAYWDDFVEAFSPVLDGSLFATSHRGAVPLPGFYLTFHESWPLNCRAHFNGNPDANLAFSNSPQYAETFVNVLRSFVRLAEERRWTRTGFQVYLNNKGSLSDPRQAPWILDEPAAFWDYRALAWFGRLTDRGRADLRTIQLDYRIDISRPEYARRELDGRNDLWVVAGDAFRKYRRLVQERIRRDGIKVWVYGSASPVEASSRTMEAWILDAWQAGAVGIVPWQTLDKTGKALTEGDQLALFIFDAGRGERPAVRTTARLRAIREAQQLVEKLQLARDRHQLSEQQIAILLRDTLGAGPVVKKTNDDDAGTAVLESLDPRRWDQAKAAVHALLASPPATNAP
ncbi:MAG: hypothetical protein ACKO2L_14845 [Planctomycetaceae bacterium]